MLYGELRLESISLWKRKIICTLDHNAHFPVQTNTKKTCFYSLYDFKLAVTLMQSLGPLCVSAFWYNSFAHVCIHSTGKVYPHTRELDRASNEINVGVTANLKWYRL